MNAPLPPDNFIACDKHKKQKARKVLDREAPPTSDCGSIAYCFGAHLCRPRNHSNNAWNPDVNYSTGRGPFESVSTHPFLPAAHRNERAVTHEVLRNQCSHQMRQALAEGDGERPQPETNAAF